ncbi:1446_t:CDS:1, partial [Dentiscutata erythropus]
MKELIYNRSNSKRQPRAQNGFVLFRKDLNAFIKDSKLTIGDVSRLACKLWNGNPSCKLWENINVNEIKLFYNKLAEIAKKVHGRSFPGYKYSPKRKKLHYANSHYANLHCYEPYYYSNSSYVFEQNQRPIKNF